MRGCRRIGLKSREDLVNMGQVFLAGTLVVVVVVAAAVAAAVVAGTVVWVC